MAESILTMPHRMTVYVVSSTLLSGSISAAQSLTTQPSEAVKLEIAVSGEITSGTIQITGELDGAVQSETKTFDQARTIRSSKFYDAVNANGIVASAGLQGGTIVIKQVDGGGAEVVTEIATRTHNGRKLKCQFTELSSGSLEYFSYGLNSGGRYYVRTIRDNPICVAPETEFSVNLPAYSGSRFKPCTDILTITPPGRRSSPEVYFHAEKVK